MKCSFSFIYDVFFSQIWNLFYINLVPFVTLRYQYFLEEALAEPLWTYSSKPVNKERNILQGKIFTTFTHIKQVWKKKVHTNVVVLSCTYSVIEENEINMHLTYLKSCNLNFQK